MFNPHPVIRQVQIAGCTACLVIDDFLLEPAKMVAFAAARRSAFAVEGGNYFPGPEIDLPDAFTALLGEYFMLHVRRLLGARRMLMVTSRLSMVTKGPTALHPLQRICHSDTMAGTRCIDPGAGEGIAATVLYLFKDASLGGTSFYAPRKGPEEMDALNRAALSGRSEAFDTILGAPPAYLTSSNAFFKQVCTVPAAYNRAIFYDGAILHSGQIDHPQRLAADPETGRLTLNGFFLHRRAAA